MTDRTRLPLEVDTSGLDERELLTKLARVPVLTLSDAARSATALAEAAAGWPLAEWVETASPEPPVEGPGPSIATDRGARPPGSW